MCQGPWAITAKRAHKAVHIAFDGPLMAYPTAGWFEWKKVAAEDEDGLR
jgi:isocitrate lyase